MIAYTKLAKMHGVNNNNPYSNKLPCNRNQLQPKPNFLNTAFFNYQPCVVKRNKGFYRINTRFFKHTVQTDMPANCTENKNDPAHLVDFNGSKNNILLKLSKSFSPKFS